MNKDNQIILLLATIFVIAIASASLIVNAWGEEHQMNISWKEQQLQEKFNNVNMSDYTSYEKQMEKVKRTQDYLKAWGWRQ